MIIVDSSIALQWVLPEDGADVAERYLLEADLVAPDVLFVEAANVLAKKVRAKDLTGDQARQALDGIRYAVRRVEVTLPIVPRALELAISLNHPVYDCVFLAVAERLGGKLATRDVKFAKRATEHGFENLLVDGAP